MGAPGRNRDSVTQAQLGSRLFAQGADDIRRGVHPRKLGPRKFQASDQISAPHPCLTLKIPLPEASLSSVSSSPVNLKRRKSFGIKNVAVRSRASGSNFCSQYNEEIRNPVVGAVPHCCARRDTPTRSFNSDNKSALR